MGEDEAGVLRTDGRFGPHHSRRGIRRRQDALGAPVKVSVGSGRAQRRRQQPANCVLANHQGKRGGGFHEWVVVALVLWCSVVTLPDTRSMGRCCTVVGVVVFRDSLVLSLSPLDV